MTSVLLSVKQASCLQAYFMEINEVEVEACKKRLTILRLPLQGDVRGRAEEAQYLRETLRRTRENLDKEKRLNSAIKSKKVSRIKYVLYL